MTDNPFQRDGSVDTPGLIGARWWQKQLVAAQPDAVTRRSALGTVLVVGGALAGIGLIIALAKSGNDDNDNDGPAPTPTPKPMLEVQQDYGWNFGARAEALTFDGITTGAYDKSALDTLVADVTPASARYLPYWSPTLFQSPGAMPTKTAEADAPDAFKPLKEVVQPVHNAMMDFAFARGRALAVALARVSDAAVIVDLPGTEAVAFAAGMAGLFDLIFAFENWPHPRGVVKAHRTLGAALYYQPLFRRKRAEASGKPPVIVLDRDRLSDYVSEMTQFDNRWTAKLPSAAKLKVLSVKRVLYVTPQDTDAKEMDDLNDDMLAWVAAGIDVRMVGASSFSPCTGKTVATATDDVTTEPYCYGGSVDTDAQLLIDYPWDPEAPKPKKVPMIPAGGARDFRPKPRVSSYSTGTGTLTAKPRPTNFGTVPVMIAVGTGAYLGWRYHTRNGSWNRAPAYGGGGFG